MSSQSEEQQLIAATTSSVCSSSAGADADTAQKATDDGVVTTVTSVMDKDAETSRNQEVNGNSIPQPAKSPLTVAVPQHIPVSPIHVVTSPQPTEPIIKVPSPLPSTSPRTSVSDPDPCNLSLEPSRLERLPTNVEILQMKLDQARKAHAHHISPSQLAWRGRQGSATSPILTVPKISPSIPSASSSASGVVVSPPLPQCSPRSNVILATPTPKISAATDNNNEECIPLNLTVKTPVKTEPVKETMPEPINLSITKTKQEQEQEGEKEVVSQNNASAPMDIPMETDSNMDTTDSVDLKSEQSETNVMDVDQVKSEKSETEMMSELLSLKESELPSGDKEAGKYE